MNSNESFRISSYLKDVIGRDLVTNEFVALFELVKNSFDAGATRVDIEFDPDDRTITIVDDGHGMSAQDIRDKWLFVAYSEKVAASDSYRDRIKPAGQFAGNKGIGRFACDTLGERLDLYSMREGDSDISKLQVDWTQFEKSSNTEFQGVSVVLGPEPSFPEIWNAEPPLLHGTVLVIKETRSPWDAESVRRLRRDLAKLIDPFGTTTDVTVSTWLLDGATSPVEGVDGPVGNQIADLLQEKTSRIQVTIDEGSIETTLFDRGRKIYTVREPSPYIELDGARIEGAIYFLNRSAKHTFTTRMGVRPIEFGSVFLFVNRFRIFPIGEEFDDTFGLNRRKQQGQSRYLGTRDVIGRVDVSARPKMFREVSSRDAGLIDDARSRALYDAIRKHMIFRLERYVVGVNWKDKRDQDSDTAEGLDTDQARARVLDVIGAIARSNDVEVLYYDEELVSATDDPANVTEKALKTMAELAASRGDAALLAQVEDTRRRIDELQAARVEAETAARRANQERVRADAKIERLEKQAAFLGSSRDVDVERVQLLMHQATIHLGHVRSGIFNAAHEVKALLQMASVTGSPDAEDVADLLASIRQSARRTATSIAGANLSADRLGAVLSFAPNIRVDLETDRIKGDLLRFLGEYLNLRVAGVPGLPIPHLDSGEVTLQREFSPVDIAVLIDNLVDNARKANASKILFGAQRKGDNFVSIHVSDDGVGIDDTKVDASKIFERGYTGFLNGTGLGLYSCQQIVKQMGGSISLVGDGTRADFEIILAGDK